MVNIYFSLHLSRKVLILVWKFFKLKSTAEELDWGCIELCPMLRQVVLRLVFLILKFCNIISTVNLIIQILFFRSDFMASIYIISLPV